MSELGVVLPVCIPACNLEPRFDYLQRVLAELAEQVAEDDVVVAVDDGSCDEVNEYLHTLDGDWPQFQPIYREPPDSWDGPCPWRIASSRNLGLAQVLKRAPDSAGVIFLDGDCLPHAGWLSAYRKALSPEIGDDYSVPFCVLFGATWPEGPQGGFSGDPRLPEPEKIAVGAPRAWERGRRLACLFERGGGGNLCVSRFLLLNGDIDGAWKRTGDHRQVFDEVYDGAFGYEETDLAVRVYHLGAEVLYLSSAAVSHLYHERGKGHFQGIERNRHEFQARTRLFAGGRGK